MNLLGLLQDQLGDTLVKQASSFLGESENTTSKAISGILPSLLGVLSSKGATESGAASLLNMINSGGHTGGVLDNLTGLFSGGERTNGLMSTGGSLLTSLLGNKLGSVVDLISSFAGVKKNSSSSLLKMAAPLIMGFIGRQVKNKALDAIGLKNLLGSQRNHIKSALPAGLSGIGSTLGLADMLGGAKETVKATSDRVVKTASTVTDNTVSTAKSGGSRLLPLLLLLAALAGGFWAWKSCGMTDKVANVTEGATELVEDAGKTVVDAGEAVVDAGKKALTATGDFLKDVTFAAGSAGEGFMNWIKGGDLEVGKKFRFSSLTFATGSANISGETAVEVDNVAAILKSYPGISIEIEGHTDNTGDPMANVTLSQERAEAVKARLVADGVDASRITTKGYGSNEPAESNDTAEGRAANRRIEIKVTKV